MNRKCIVLVAVAAFLGIAGAAGAHELILKPEKMEAPKGTEVALEIQSTHKFVVPEEMEDVSVMKAGVFRNGTIEPIGLKGNEPKLRIDSSFKVADDGATLVVCEKRPVKPYSRTNQGAKSGTRKELETQGLKVMSSIKYEKFAKVIVNAKAGDANFATVVGQELEIVPVTNPADIKVGGYADFKVICKGQPTSVPVWATYDGFCPEYENTYAFYSEGDKDGVVHVKITQPGFWMVRAMTNDPTGVSGEYDSRQLRSVLTFLVK